MEVGGTLMTRYDGEMLKNRLVNMAHDVAWTAVRI